LTIRSRSDRRHPRIIVISYRQTIVPTERWWHIVAKENLGTNAGLVAAAHCWSTTLTVSVSVAASGRHHPRFLNCRATSASRSLRS
jgi:hypothetical protein